MKSSFLFMSNYLFQSESYKFILGGHFNMVSTTLTLLIKYHIGWDWECCIVDLHLVALVESDVCFFCYSLAWLLSSSRLGVDWDCRAPCDDCVGHQSSLRDTADFSSLLFAHAFTSLLFSSAVVVGRNS